MIKYKIISYLLCYPNKRYIQDIEKLKAELVNITLNRVFQENIYKFINYLSTNDIYTLQVQYVSCFDNNPSLSLYLFDHIIGDSKEKGAALVNLKNEYLNYNFDTLDNESPDFLPLFLEFISQLKEEDAKKFLEPVSDLFNELCLRHRKVKSPYSILFENLVIAMGNDIIEKEVNVLTEEDIDKMWKEQEINFSNKF